MHLPGHNRTTVHLCSSFTTDGVYGLFLPFACRELRSCEHLCKRTRASVFSSLGHIPRVELLGQVVPPCLLSEEGKQQLCPPYPPPPPAAVFPTRVHALCP